MDNTYIKAVKLMLRIALGLIGHNGAGNQAAGQPLGRLPQAARSSAGGKAQLKKFISMAPCLGSRKPIEIFFINTNLKL